MLAQAAELEVVDGVPGVRQARDERQLLVTRLAELMPEGPLLYPPSERTDQPSDVHLAELIREQVLRRTREELPHAVEVAVDEVAERDDGLIEVSAQVWAETDSQKAILIGKGGRMVREIGTAARKEARAGARREGLPRSPGPGPGALAPRRGAARPAGDRLGRLRAPAFREAPRTARRLPAMTDETPADAGAAAIRFDERGLVPCVMQDWRTGEVLTLAYMNADALQLTRQTGESTSTAAPAASCGERERPRATCSGCASFATTATATRWSRWSSRSARVSHRRALVFLPRPGRVRGSGARGRCGRGGAGAGCARGTGCARPYARRAPQGPPRGLLHGGADRRSGSDRRQGARGGRRGRAGRGRRVRRAGRRGGGRPALSPRGAAARARRAARGRLEEPVAVAAEASARLEPGSRAPASWRARRT